MVIYSSSSVKISEFLIPPHSPISEFLTPLPSPVVVLQTALHRGDFKMATSKVEVIVVFAFVFAVYEWCWLITVA